MKLKAILFDHDGTLVDSEITHYKIWQEILSGYDIDLSEQDYKDYHSGIPTIKNAAIIIEKHDLSIPAQELIDKKEALTHEFLNKTPFPLMQGAKETIQDFHNAGLRLGIVTGAGRFGVDSTLKGHQLEEYFEVITTGEDVMKSKPDPAVYQLALDKLGLKAAECIALEDTENGIRAAISAGLVCCAIRNDFSSSHDLSNATQEFDDMESARHWIISNHIS